MALSEEERRVLAEMERQLTGVTADVVSVAPRRANVTLITVGVLGSYVPSNMAASLRCVRGDCSTLLHFTPFCSILIQNFRLFFPRRRCGFT